MCCLAKPDLKDSNGNTLSFEKQTIEEIWNSPRIIEARRKMLAGERVAECFECYNEEKLGPHSMRIGFNQKWFEQEKDAIYERVEESKKDNYKLSSMPWYYDIRQGNLCNLKCRSCFPENSVAIEKEYEAIKSQDPWFEKNFRSPVITESYRRWYKNPNFTEQFLAQLPNIKKLYFTGGEPTLIESNYDLLQKCIDLNLAGNIELMFNTNTTRISDRFIDLLSHFRYVLLNLSIDGFGREQEYLRAGSDWTTIKANLEKLAAAKKSNVEMVLNPVFQACNAVSITKLFYFVEDLNSTYGDRCFYIMPIILNGSKHLVTDILPKSVRKLASERLMEYLKKSKLAKNGDLFTKRIHQMIELLNSENDPDPEAVARFIRFTKTLDARRNQDFREYFPELYRLWTEADNSFNWNTPGL